MTTISDLKAHLSTWLEAVQGGDDVLVTDRGRPVARLIPVAASEVVDERVAALCRAGLARAGETPLDEAFWSLPRPADPTGAALRTLLDERDRER